MRGILGTWGAQLSESDLAIAILALGLVPEELRIGLSTSEQENGLLSLLENNRENVLSWFVDSLPIEAGSWSSKLRSETLVAIVRKAQIYERRISLKCSGQIDPIAFWIYLKQHTSQVTPGIDHWSYFVSMPAPKTIPRFRWPIRIGYFSHPVGWGIGHSLQGMDRWNGCVYKVLELNRRHTECDILVCEGLSLSHVVEELSRESLRLGGVSADLLYLCISQPIDPGMRYEDLSPLFRGVEANGAYLINATNPASGAENLIKAIEVLSHNLPIDCAFTEVSGGNGLLVIDERLIAKSRISDRVHTLGKILQRPENASRSITIDNSSAMLLRLPKSTLLREEAGREIEKVHLDYGFLRESDEASAIGHTVMQLQQDDDKSNVPRYLQAGISMPGKDSPVTDKPLVRNKPYEVLVFVGARNSEYLASVEAFPKLQPLDDGRSHQLTVVFWEQNVSEAPQVQHIDLPSVGDSEVCRFSIHTPARIVELHARITLLHKNRVLQTGILIAPVGRKSCEYSFVLDAVPRRVLNGLDERLNFDLAMVVNDIAGLSQVHLSGGSQAAVLKWDHQDIQGLIKIIGASIGQITENPDDFSGLFASGSTKLLRRLAQKGASFRKYLQTVQGFNLSNVSHIQLIIADPTKVLPIEFFYDFPAPEPTAALCVNAARALEFARNDSLDSGRCPGGCPDQPEDQIICPVAFWGIRCIIERRAHRPDEEDINGDARVISEPVLLGDRILNPTVSAVVGATDKANPPSDPDATKKMIERIKAVVGKFREVHNWDEWKGAVADINPSLLTLIVHQEEDDYGTPELDIGQPPNLNSDLIKTAHVPQLTHPVFLLIGCETSLADISYENIAFRFHTEGAVIVVSTIARILGRQAAPLAAEIIEELANLPSSTPFGSVLRNVRCRMLEKGTPMVMALTALGDADWEVVGQSGV